MIKAEKLPFHYGWLIVFACGVGMFVIFPLVYTIPGIYLVPITEDLGIPRTLYSMSLTLQTLMSALASFLMSKIIRRFPATRVMAATAAFLGLNLISYNLLSTVPGLFVRAAINGFCCCLCGNIMMIIVFQRWFQKNLNFAMSLAFTMTGVGGMLFSQIFPRVLVSSGWRTCYLISGILVLAVVVPVYTFVLRESPEKVGLRPYGAESLDGVEVAAPEASGPMFKDAIRHWFFIPLMLSLMIVSMSSGCTQNHFQPSLLDSGYQIATIGTIMSIYSALNSITKLSVGVIFDRIGPKVGLFIVLMGYVVGYMALAFAGVNQALGFVSGIGFGIGIAWSTLGVPFVISTIFGRRDYAAIYGFCSMLSQVASALVFTGAGVVYDLVGTYFPIWIIFSVGCALAYGVFMYGVNKQFFLKIQPQSEVAAEA